MDDIKLSPINYDGECRYVGNLEEIKTHIKIWLLIALNLDHTWLFTKCRLMHES